MASTPSLLVTGGTGFVGRRLAPQLAARFPDHQHIMLARSSAEPIPSGWAAEIVDLTRPERIEDAIERFRPRILIHLAAQASVAQAAQAAEAMWNVNFCATYALAKAVAAHAPRSLFFFASTADVYGASFNNGPVQESTPASPVNSYAMAKLAGERVLRDLLPDETRLIIARAFNHSGAGQDERFVLPSFAAQIARAEAGKAPRQVSVGNLEVERDFLHVDDVVDAYVRLVDVSETLPQRTVVNVASGKAWRLSTLLGFLLKKARYPINVVVDRERLRPTDIPRAMGDAKLLTELTGWRPRREVESILDELLASFRAD